MSIRLTDITAQTVWTPAPEKSVDEYQDAFFPEQTATAPGTRGVTRFSMADGASRSGHSRQWARFLVSEWGKDPANLSFRSSLALASNAWGRWGEDRAAQAVASPGHHDWFQASFPEDALAYATLLVVQIYPGRYPRWFAAAVGDTFVFHVRANELRSALPRRTGRRVTPRLISTKRSLHYDKPETVDLASARLLRGDELFLSTDALGHWIADFVDRGSAPWAELRTQIEQGASAFQTWINELRARNEVDPDDTTLMRIAIG